MNGKLYLNGTEIKKIESFKIEFSDNCNKVDFPLSNKGELNFIFEPNWLWKYQQKTGIPKRIKILPW